MTNKPKNEPTAKRLAKDSVFTDLTCMDYCMEQGVSLYDNVVGRIA